jgi:arsenate reductase
LELQIQIYNKEDNGMNIQIFGKSKCFDTKKAERYFKERGIKFQSIDMLQKGMSKGEFNSVKQAVGGYENMIDEKTKDQDTLMLVKYLAEEDKEAKLLENPKLFKTPIVRNGRQATTGYQSEVWETWE